jgi:hypothetical protein
MAVQVMSHPSVRISLRRLMVLVAVAAAVMAISVGSETVYYSCHLCHNRKDVVSRFFLGVPLKPREVATTSFPTEPGHTHDWYCFGRSWSSLIYGSAAGSGKIYRDGSRAPDF